MISILTSHGIKRLFARFLVLCLLSSMIAGVSFQPAVHAATLISNFQCFDPNTGSTNSTYPNKDDWSVRTDLQVGDLMYGDRNYTFTSVPASLIGCEWIRPANDSRNRTVNPLIEFDVAAGTDIYIVWDSNATGAIDWITTANGWTDTGEIITTSDGKSLRIDKKSFSSAEKVTLGKNFSGSSSSANGSQYIIIAKAAGTSSVSPSPSMSPTPSPSPTPVVSPSPTSSMVANMVVNDNSNRSDWSIRNDLQVTDLQYGDRTYGFKTIPSVLLGSEWIRTANDSRSYTAGAMVTFQVTANSDVFVAHTDEVAAPSWLTSEWTDTGAEIVNNYNTPTSFSIYKKAFSAGSTVTLHQNGATNRSMYTIIVRPEGTTTFPATSPSPSMSPTPTPPPSTGNAGSIYVTTTGAGKMDGSSWDNAMQGDKTGGMQAAWDAAAADGTVYIGSGMYTIKQTLIIGSSGASLDKPKRLVGFDTGAGLPEFKGPWNYGNQGDKTKFIKVNADVNYWWIKDIKVSNYFYGLETSGKNVGYRIYNFDVSDSEDALYLRGGDDGVTPNTNSNDIVIKDCDFKNFTKHGIRFRDGNYNAQVINCTADAGGAAFKPVSTTDIAMGFQVANNTQAAGVFDHNITFIDCVARNSHQGGDQPADKYWNGDGFCAERAAYDLVYIRCKAFNNTDGGWDDKSSNPTLVDCVSIGNKRNFRFWSYEKATLINCLSAFTMPAGSGAYMGLWAGNDAIVEAYNCTFYDNYDYSIAPEGGTIRLFDCIVGTTDPAKQLYKVDTAVYPTSALELYNVAEYISGVKGADPQLVAPSSSWDGEGKEFNSQRYGTTRGYHYVGATQEPMPISTMPVDIGVTRVLASGGDIYVTPKGAGTMDGTSWANAMSGNRVGGLQAAWDSAASDGTVFVGSGSYNVPQTLNLSSGQSLMKPRRIVGVDTGTGLPVFTGDWELTNQFARNLFYVPSGVSYWWIQDIKVNNYQYPVYTEGKNVGVRIFNLDMQDVRDGLYMRGGNDTIDGSLNSHDIVVKDCDVVNHAFRGFRFRDGNYNVRVINCHNDGGGQANWYTSNFPFGFQVANSPQDANVFDHDIVFANCSAQNMYRDDGGSSKYWNGDSFVAERQSYGITYVNCGAYGNTDGGWDDKSKNPVFVNCVAVYNKRNFRIWSEQRATFVNCIGAYAYKRGGSGSADGIWVGESGGKIEIYNSTFHGNDSYSVYQHSTGAKAWVFDSILSLTSGAQNLFDNSKTVARYVYNTELYIPGVQGQNPMFVNPSAAWKGNNKDMDSQLYGLTKGYHYIGSFISEDYIDKATLKSSLSSDAVMRVNEPVTLSVKGFKKNGAEIDLAGTTIQYECSNPELVNINQGTGTITLNSTKAGVDCITVIATVIKDSRKVISNSIKLDIPDITPPVITTPWDNLTVTQATYNISYTVSEYAFVTINGGAPEEKKTTDKTEVPVNLVEGDNQFVITAVDKAGNTSESKVIVVTLDTVKPVIKLNQVNGTVTQAVYTISGSLSERASITVNGNSVMVNSDLTFSTTVNLSVGDNKITVAATDKAGYAADPVEIVIRYEQQPGTGTTDSDTSSDGGGTPVTYTPTATPTPTPVHEPSVQGGKVVMPQPIVDESGKATVDVPTAPMEKAIENVSNTEIKRVVVDIPVVESAVKITTKLPAQILATAETADIERIQINLGKETISIAPNAFGKVSSTAKSIEFSVETINKSTLSPNIASIVGNNLVHDFNAYIDGTQVSKFNGNRAVQISLDYQLSSGESQDNIVVFYLNDKGQLEVVKNSKFNPETGNVSFTANHLGKYAAVHINVSFKDIVGVDWAKGSIEALAARGIINGVGDNIFAPNSKVTRAQFIKMVMGAFELVDETATSSFSDVHVGEWYYTFVASAQKLGIIKGYEDGTFGVDKEISRQEMAAIAYRTAIFASIKLSQKVEVAEFADKNEIQPYALEAIVAMQKAGIINGVGENRFAPNNNSTRAEAAKIVYGLFKLFNY